MCQELKNTYAELTASNETIKAQAEAMQELSLRDELTGLHNRRYFNQQFRLMHHQAIRYGDSLTLALGDIDHFKLINDRYSHQIGDAVLKQLAQLMQEEIRESDVLARYGGEEFVLLMPQTSKPQAEQLLNRIRVKVETWPWDNICKGLSVTISLASAISCRRIWATVCWWRLITSFIRPRTKAVTESAPERRRVFLISEFTVRTLLDTNSHR